MIPRSAVLGGLAAAVAVMAAGALTPGGNDRASAAEEPAPAAATASYVAETTCRGCHAAEFKAWQRSHHAHAMERPSDASVRGDFADTEFESGGTGYRFSKRNGDYYVSTEGPDGEPGEFRIAYTFGWTPLQQYLVELDKGRLQALTVAWDTEAETWFDLAEDDPAQPGDPLHWTGREYNWNFRCADCHSTDLRRNYDAETDSYDTTYSAVNVGCQACHGPGSGHIDWLGKGQPEAVENAGFGVAVSAEAELETCAQCHSRRRPITPHFVAGEPFLDHYVPDVLRDGLYFPDGQIDDEVFVYGSFLQSRMHQKGVTCSDCHDPHSGELWADGNAVCTACHNETPPDRFPTIKPLAYDSPAHHFHEEGQPGAFCVDCHMPARTYMTVDPRRDHGFRVPRPDLSEATDAPDACTGCHDDRDAVWAAQTIAEWYGEDRRREPHFGEAIALGRRGAPGARDALSALATDAEKPAIARATAVELLRQFVDARSAETVAAAAQDGDPLVRMAAMQALGAFPPDARADIAAPLLDDPLRAVRIAAARALAPVPSEAFLGDRRAPYQRAVDEYIDSELAVAERPESHLNLGLYWSEHGDAEASEAAYRRALELDPDFTPALINLAELYRATGRSEEEAMLLERAGEANPEDASVLHALGLLRVRQKRYDEALALLEKAAEAAPENSRFAHVYAVALDSMGRPEEAKAFRADALARDPYDVDLLGATLQQLLKDRDLYRARQIVDRLIALRPDDAELRALKDRLAQ
jgi:predicted CXXCH cytochrome family protein